MDLAQPRDMAVDGVQCLSDSLGNSLKLLAGFQEYSSVDDIHHIVNASKQHMYKFSAYKLMRLLPQTSANLDYVV